MADSMIEVRCTLTCPHCGADTCCDFEALRTSGVLPITYEKCEACRSDIRIEASIDVSVEAA